MTGTDLKKQGIIVTVTLTVMAIVFSQLSCFQVIHHTKDTVKTEQNEEPSGEQIYISLPSSNLPSSTHVELNQTMVFLFEILFEKKEIQKENFNVLLPPNRFFKALFTSVISPNAP